MRDRSPRRHAAAALLEAFREDSFDPADAQAPLQTLDEQRDGVARAVAAAVKGPEAVAEYAAVIEILASRLRDWLASIVSEKTARN
jgi:hypothetical protein